MLVPVGVTCNLCMVEPPIKHPPKRDSLSTMDTFLGTKVMVVLFFSLRERTTSLQRTNLPPMCPLFRGSTVLPPDSMYSLMYPKDLYIALWPCYCQKLNLRSEAKSVLKFNKPCQKVLCILSCGLLSFCRFLEF